jgi:restriction endonuclease S subunit
MTIETLQGYSYTHFVQVSIDRPIVPQIWSNMTELSPAQLRKIETDLRKLEVEQKKTAKIKELEDMIAKANAELAKLKK